jgi:hypothetical protein
MDMEQLAEVVKEIEEEKALGRVAAVTVFKGLLNQPELVSLSSANASAVGGSYGYSQFSVNMPRPILEAETLQLLAANIPLCTQNIPDTACTFWYYRLDEYANPVPSTENLFFVRLLPSYYKPEFFQPTPVKYGQNITFDTYTDVSTQLALSCTNDIGYNNLASAQSAGEVTNFYQMQFIPSDISIFFNSSTKNKFIMEGLNTTAPLFQYSAADTYAAGTTYDADEYVSYDKKVYRSLLDGNVANTPDAEPTYWAYVTDKLVQDFVAYTPYYAGQYCVSGGVIYQASINIWTGSFSTLDGWVAPTAEFNYRYLVTGYADPNVVLNQGTGLRQWTPYALFEYGDLVQYQGVAYAATKQNKGFLPFYIPNQTTNAYSAGTTYAIGDYVYYTSKWYVCIKAATGTAPTGLYTNNTVWKFIEWSPNTTTVFWKAGDLMTYTGTVGNGVFFYKCIKDNNVSQASPITTGGVFDTNPYWIPSYWTPQTTTANVPIIGLNAISTRFDMLDIFLNNGWLQFPFPVAIPGQPFNPAPRRLLNSILGFCWNGIFNPLAVSKVLATGTTIPDGTTTTDVLNRIRPVPIYKTYGTAPALLSASRNSTLTPVFTADGYGNLVYTNVINIYTTIVYGSTLDSQRNTNLISTASINAGNLGVGFFANFIDGKLRVNRADIYTISIELRDEVGELYPMTNNGNCSFTLKLTYKDIDQENKA